MAFVALILGALLLVAFVAIQWLFPVLRTEMPDLDPHEWRRWMLLLLDYLSSQQVLPARRLQELRQKPEKILQDEQLRQEILRHLEAAAARAPTPEDQAHIRSLLHFLDLRPQ